MEESITPDQIPVKTTIVPTWAHPEVLPSAEQMERVFRLFQGAMQEQIAGIFGIGPQVLGVYDDTRLSPTAELADG